MYERQDGTGLEIGSYAHRPILHDPDEIPSIEEAALSPTELPFTQADFDAAARARARADARDRRRRAVGVKYAINGLLSLTPDGLPLLGETPEVQGPLVGRRRVGQGGPRRRQVGRRVDDARRVRDRPAVVRHRALLRAPEDARPREGARRRGVQQDLRHRPPVGAVGVESQRPPLAVLRARARARRGLLRDRRLGAAALVRVERAAARGVRRPRRRAARPSGTRAGGRRSSTPSTSRCASARRCSTSPRSCVFDVIGPGALDVAAARGDAPDGRRGRPGRLHARAHADGRLPLRPDDHAARRRAVPRRHGRRARAWPT